MWKLTLDTNVVRDFVEPDRLGHEAAKQLVGFHEAGECEIRVTTRLDIDVPDGPLRVKLESLEVLNAPRVGSLFRLDYSALDSGDFLADEAWVQDANEIMDLLFPGGDPDSPRHKNRIADVDHLMGHKLSGRDVFLTNEKAFLERKADLRGRFGITVMSPAEFLNQA